MTFFSLTEAPLTNPAATPPNTPETDPKRTRNRPETEPKRSQTEPNGAKRSRNGPKSSPLGWDGRGGFVGMGRGGGCKGKRVSLFWAVQRLARYLKWAKSRDWRFVLNTPIQQNCEKGCDLSPRSKIASDWRLAILPI